MLLEDKYEYNVDRYGVSSCSASLLLTMITIVRFSISNILRPNWYIKRIRIFERIAALASEDRRGQTIVPQTPVCCGAEPSTRQPSNRPIRPQFSSSNATARTQPSGSITSPQLEVGVYYFDNIVVVDFRSLPSFKRTVRLVDVSKHLIGVYNNYISVYNYCQFYHLVYVFLLAQVCVYCVLCIIVYITSFVSDSFVALCSCFHVQLLVVCSVLAFNELNDEDEISSRGLQGD